MTDGVKAKALEVKYFLEWIAAGMLLVVTFPGWILIGILVKLDTPGPVFYRRRVVGCRGHLFDAFKFRTMFEHSEERVLGNPALWSHYELNVKLKHDPRVTRTGKLLRRLSLDELPQLLNVIAGQMTLIGPRMLSPSELERYGANAKRRQSIKPGITGLWQVSGRQELNYEERIELDLRYINDWSPWLDFQILLRTILAVLSMRGAF